MKIRNTAIFLPLLGLLATGSAMAESLVDGSIEAGKNKAITCTACHGPEGNSVNPLWPNIAGQSATYTVTQLTAFRDGAASPANAKRYDPLMSPQSMALSDQDIRDLAVYFESLPAPAQAVANPSTIARAEALYRGGDVEDGTAACLACHGPTGRGNPAANYPALQGQHAVYTAKQLNDYASGKRTSDGKTRVMRDIAARLSQEDIDALASYVQGLR
ncbi:MAG: c-type cytochrome [Woeseiaceae bacterium]|nr:c-type cytochrome [Woeseiaceae bacterium]NIP21551.1 c-type cytochrome [Woeseiaceae bacterium]NIS90539.1 c-type cytochrome [Woeseiaceae bacterium]